MVRSAHTGGAHDLTSDGPPTPEVEMAIAPLADSIARRADILPPGFVRSRTNVGLDGAWVHLAGALDLATTPQLERTLRDSQSQAQLVVLDLRELAFMDSPARTPSSTPASALGSSAVGWCSCAAPRTSTAYSR